MIHIIEITPQELIQMGWNNINETDFKEYTYFQFNPQDKTVKLFTVNKIVQLEDNPTELSNNGQPIDYFRTFKELDNIGKLMEYYYKRFKQ